LCPSFAVAQPPLLLLLFPPIPACPGIGDTEEDGANTLGWLNFPLSPFRVLTLPALCGVQCRLHSGLLGACWLDEECELWA
jgi:hypothetical protein